MCGIPTKCVAHVNKAYVWYPKLFYRLPLVNALEETFRSFFVTIEDKKARVKDVFDRVQGTLL